MRDCKELLHKLLRERMHSFRSRNGFSQERMAEALHISTRSYLDQEHGRYGFSSLSLVYYMLLLSEEEVLILLRDVREILEMAEENAA